MGMNSHGGLLLLLKVMSLFSGHHFFQGPFLPVWNAPTEKCLSQYGVDLDLGTFNIFQNVNQTFIGGNVTIFYRDKLGLYPRYSGQVKAVNGGVPQNASLDKHLQVASEDIRSTIPDRDYQGLAVVDWESWRPVWERNWDAMEVYKKASRALVSSKHPDWKPEQVEDAAQQQFEEAARNFMEETLKLGQKERPYGLWGYYSFPDCYNYMDVGTRNYTGECRAIEKERNDKLLWLWNVSSALYPNIYLNLDMRGIGTDVLLFARHRILEALRISAKVAPSGPPVFPYSRIVYTFTLEFLSQAHLVYTIGESAALGSAGIVLWGDNAFAMSKATCETIKSFIDETLGPYLVNVTSAATLCSQALCSSQGRCQRRNPGSGAYLHLNPASWKVVSEKTPESRRSYRVLGGMKTQDLKLMTSEFKCQCYPGWGGESCTKPTPG